MAGYEYCPICNLVMPVSVCVLVVQNIVFCLLPCRSYFVYCSCAVVSAATLSIAVQSIICTVPVVI